jgi:hypothetical protein
VIFSIILSLPRYTSLGYIKKIVLFFYGNKMKTCKLFHLEKKKKNIYCNAVSVISRHAQMVLLSIINQLLWQNVLFKSVTLTQRDFFFYQSSYLRLETTSQCQIVKWMSRMLFLNGDFTTRKSKKTNGITDGIFSSEIFTDGNNSVSKSVGIYQQI